tara:strand:- start:4602 stop:4928 length:327 start_codon:yes stop_codon:yes gene_type:complete
MSNLKEKIDVLENQSWDLDLVIGQVNNKTKEIKYNDVPMNIYIAIQNLAEENGIDEQELEWKIDEVRKYVNKLESAVYDLVEPFEEKKRDIDNEKDDLEWELEESDNS